LTNHDERKDGDEHEAADADAAAADPDADATAKKEPKEGQKASGKEKKKPRQHDLKNIDTKGRKILRKLARFLLKQFLHPREFFGKAIQK